MNTIVGQFDAIVSVHLAIAAAVIFVAGVSRGMLGFGATLILVPCLIPLYGAVETVAIASLIEIPAVLYLLPTTVREANWRHIAPVGFASLATIPLGAWFLVSVDPDLARRIIATVVIVFALALASGWRYRGRDSMGLRIGVGAASGVMGGMANIGGPVVVMFLVASNTAAAGVRAGIMAYFSFSTAYRIAVFALLGMYAAGVLAIAVALFAPYLLGIALGRRLFARATEAIFLRLAIGLVFCAGLVALFK